MTKHNDITTSILMILIAAILVVGLLTSCAPGAEEAAPLPCENYDVYKTVATTLIDQSAATYVEYVQGKVPYEDAILETSMIYKRGHDKLSCDNIEESADVLTILRNTRDAIPAGKLSNPAVENMYIDQAYNLINDLNVNWDWEI